jgi:penicillin-binding protein 1A
MESPYRKLILGIGLLCTCIGVGYGYWVIDSAIQFVGSQAFAATPLPDITAAPVESTKIYDRTGNLIYEIGSSRRRSVKIDEVPEHVKNAFLAAEDRTFYSNPGVSIKSLIRAIHVDVREERLTQGGSTITQQLAQQLVVSKENTIWRKMREIIISLVMTRQYTKDEILERYLNEAPVGGELVGIGAAAQEYFHVSVRELTLAQGAYLASLINAPSILDPYANYEGLTDRQQLILNRMQEFGFISEQERLQALQQQVEFQPRTNVLTHPHFSFYVRHLLEKEFDQAVVGEGLTVQTSLDPQLQRQAEQLLAAQVEENTKNWNAANASLIAANPTNGQILAYVGGVDFSQSQVDMNSSRRQPGSTIKPLFYYTAFEQGYTPETYVLDAVEDFGGGWRPTNYGGTSSGRYVQLNQALAGSLNIPAVRVMRGVGIDKSVANLDKMGFPVIKKYNYTLPLALGAVEVTPLDMTQAYATLANQGHQVTVSPLLKVVDRHGKVLLDRTASTVQKSVLKQSAVRAVTGILSDYQLKRRLYGGQYYIDYTLPDRPVAAKTGTSSGPKDAWTIGFTPSLLTTVWAGNTSGADLKSTADGINVAAPLWHDFMVAATKDKPVESFPEYKSQKPDAEHRYIDRAPRGYNPDLGKSATPSATAQPSGQP